LNKLILIIVLIIAIVPLYGGCSDDDDSDGDCSDNAENAYIANLGQLPTSPTPVHPSDVPGPEFCNPLYYNCTSCPTEWKCQCRNVTASGFHDCDCEFPSCEGCTVVFEENCTRSEYVDDYGLMCGEWGKPERAGRADEVIHEDGFMPRANAGINNLAQCFVGKYLDNNGGNPNDLTPYFPLPYPNITVTGRRCDGAPEDTIFVYNTNGISIKIDNQYYSDCMACPSFHIYVNDVGYNLRQDPHCGRDIDGSGWGSSYCQAFLNSSTTNTTVNSTVNSS
jgi:hypothetical protein